MLDGIDHKIVGARNGFSLGRLARSSLRRRTERILLFSLFIAALATAPVNAQVVAGETDEGPETVDQKEFQGVEEMMVEARRRSENLQKIGESVSSFSDNDIIDAGLTNFNDLQYNVPNLFSGGGLTKITLRGVGSEIVGPGVDPGFAVHVNSVFSAREGTGLINFFDIERVDVLRGPQGTLWGRNSTGGAINIVTKKAQHEFGSEATAQYEWFKSDADGFLVTGVFNMPLVEDELALRVALLTTMDDGQMEQQSENHSQRVGDAAASALRASLRWEPHDDLTIDFVGSWLRANGAGAGRKFEGDFEPATPPAFNSVAAGAGIDYTGALPNPNSVYKGTANEPQRSDSTVWSATLLVAWEADDFIFDSITGYQSTDFFLHRDQDLSSLPIATLDLTDESRQISQEFIVNSSWEYPVAYTVGAIYQYDWTPQTLVDVRDAQATEDALDYFLSPAYPFLLNNFPAPLSFVDTCPPPLDFSLSYADSCPDEKLVGSPYEVFTRAVTEVDNHVFGLYANVSWEIVERLTLSVGGRYSYTNRNWKDETVAQTFAGVADAGVLGLLGLQVLQLGQEQSETWQAGTWKVGVEWEATDDNLLWVSVGTGSRAGGFNFAQESSFNAEEIFSVEAGIKNAFFDNLVSFNLTGFWYDWTDIQIGATEGALPLVKNVPTARSYGVEFEWHAIPAPNLILNGSFGWLEANFDSDFEDPDNTRQDLSMPLGQRATIVNLNGNRLPRSPRFTVSVGAMYVIEAGRWGTFAPRIDSYYRDDVQFRQYGNPRDVAPSYTRTDVRVIWRSETEQFWGEIFVRNLEDNEVKTNQETIGSIYRTYYYDNPRSGGIRVGYSY
jgi:iron complex outermembrane receptor protein